MNTQTSSLRQAWHELKQQEPGIRIRNAADILGVSEFELLTTEVGNEVTILKPEFKNILQAIGSLGLVMALTRNEEVVHERKGVYLNPELENPHVGLFTGKDIDLRIFFHCWKYAVAVETGTTRGVMRSFQFFTDKGVAIHKIFLTPESDLAAWESIRHSFQSEEQLPIPIEDRLPTPPENELLDECIDIPGFQQAWQNLEDTHDFFGMLKKFKVSRTQAMRLGPENMAIPLSPEALPVCLLDASGNGVSIMAFVGNPGMIQIHSGLVKKVFQQNDWFNVMDPEFNLHIFLPGINQVWLVRKPTKDGVVTALECFNSNGDQVLQLFGERKPGIPELEAWRRLTGKLESEYTIRS